MNRKIQIPPVLSKKKKKRKGRGRPMREREREREREKKKVNDSVELTSTQKRQKECIRQQTCSANAPIRTDALDGLHPTKTAAEILSEPPVHVGVFDIPSQ
jgi:hypothetical protein